MTPFSAAQAQTTRHQGLSKYDWGEQVSIRYYSIQPSTPRALDDLFAPFNGIHAMFQALRTVRSCWFVGDLAEFKPLVAHLRPTRRSGALSAFIKSCNLALTALRDVTQHKFDQPGLPSLIWIHVSPHVSNLHLRREWGKHEGPREETSCAR